MNFNKIKYLIYAFLLTRKYGNKLEKTSDPIEKKRLRIQYSKILFSKLNIVIDIKNKENIPLKGQYLIFSNHRSVLDPLSIDIIFEKSAIFGLWVAKKELYNIPVLKKGIKHGGCIQLDRDSKDTKLFFSNIKEGLAQGSSIFIFPEGTRNKTNKDLLEFKKGVRIIAIKNRLALLPIYIKSNTSDVLQQALLDNSIQRKVTIIIGNLIPYSDQNNLETTYRTMFNLNT